MHLLAHGLGPVQDLPVPTWLFFTIAAVLPLTVAVIMMLVAPERTKAVLDRVRAWLERNAMRVAAVIILLLALSLLRNGIAGLTS